MKEPIKTLATLISLDAYLDTIGYNTDEIKENIDLSKKELDKAFSLQGVSNQRELLFALANDFKINFDECKNINPKQWVDAFLKSK